jgi:predicted TIM-barrel fold metal-dependent hydrolase
MTRLVSDSGYTPVSPCHDGTITGLLRSMDKAGVEKTFLCSVATRPSQVRKITEWSASIACERIIPFASIHPDYEEPEAEIERIARLGLKGLKFHPQYMQCALDDKRTLRIAKAASQAGLAMFFHSGYDLAYDRDSLASPLQMRRLLDAVPDLRVNAAHLGGWHRWEEVLKHLAGQPVYFDTSFTIGHCPNDLLERILSVHSPEYLLFGSDSPWSDPATELERFNSLPLSEDAKTAALWTNPHRFVGIQEPPL